MRSVNKTKFSCAQFIRSQNLVTIGCSMARTKKRLEQDKKKKKKKVPLVKCMIKEKQENGRIKICGQTFSKQSNLNAHIQKVHQGLRWVCPECEKTQVSKDSHIRHGKTHGLDFSSTATQNEFYLKNKVRQTEAAKDAHIAALMRTVAKQAKIIGAYKTELMKAKKILFDNNLIQSDASQIDEELIQDEIESVVEESVDSEHSNEAEEEEEGKIQEVSVEEKKKKKRIAVP